MSKSFIVLFLVFISFATLAKDTIYGRFAYSIGRFTSESASGSKTHRFHAVDNNSRLGFKGSKTEKGINWAMKYHLELGAQNDVATGETGIKPRFYYGSLKHKSAGSFRVGRFTPAYKESGVRIDPFYDTASGVSNASRNFGQSALNNGWSNNSFMYSSPDFGGVKMKAMTAFGDSGSSSADYSSTLYYMKNGIDIGFSFTKANAGAVIPNSTAHSKAYKAFAKYKADKWSFGLQGEKIEKRNALDPKFLYVAGTFNTSEKTYLALSFGQVAGTGSSATNGNSYSLGAFHNILSKTKLSFLISNTEYKNKAKDTRFVTGIRHDFSWGL